MHQRYNRFGIALMSCLLAAVLSFSQQQNLYQVLKKVEALQEDQLAEQAIDVLTTSIQHTAKDNDTLALLHHQLGVNQYNTMQDEAAIETWEEALSLWNTFYPNAPNDSIKTLIIKAYRNIGTAEQSLKQYERAKVALENSLNIFDASNILKSSDLFSVYKSLGGIYVQLNDFANAKLYLDASLKISQQIAAKDTNESWRVAEAYNELVLFYQKSGEPKNMIDYGQKALEVLDQIEDKYEEDYFLMADVYNNLALAHEQRQNYALAIDYYKKCAAINLAHAEQRQSALSINYNNLAYVYLMQKEHEQALAYVEDAMRINENLNEENTLSGNYHTKGNILQDQGQLQAAVESYQTGINYLFPKLDLKEVESLPSIEEGLNTDRIFLLRNLYGKAQALQLLSAQTNTLANLKMALRTYDLLSQLIDQVRIDFESDESKAFLAKEAKTIYEDAIATCFALSEATTYSDYLAQAFAFSEKSKSLILLEAIRENEIKKNIGIPAEQLEQEEALKREVASLEQALYEATAESDQIDLSKRLIVARNDLSQFLKQLEKSEPAYYQLKYDIDIPSVAAVQAQLKDEAILEYFVGKAHIYWFVVDQTQFLSGKIPKQPQFKQQVQDFRYSISNRNEDQLDQDSLALVYAKLGYDLYQILFDELPLNELQTKQVRIIPDGVLGYLPFDALLTNRVPTDQVENYSAYPFLHHRFQLSYTYSVALLQEMKRIQHRPKQSVVLAFAPIFESRKPLQLGQMSILLPPLLQNIKSTKQILEMVAGQPYLGEAAVKDAFLQNAGDYAYLHLASHAQMNDENANYSFISFAQLEAQISKDQLLFVSELYNMKLNAEMVVLSACETGVGELEEGEGIISLARAFSYAGAKSIVTSLWQVNDQYTGQLMLHFYENLAQDFSKDKALHQAKQRMIEGGFQAHPYYWASFISIGDMSRLESETAFSSVWLLVGLLIVSSFLLLLVFRLRKS
ncbi:MAG: CHAT domain-containing tetratricopeptide repeat protein [Bacteroidota bacterium]